MYDGEGNGRIEHNTAKQLPSNFLEATHFEVNRGSISHEKILLKNEEGAQ